MIDSIDNKILNILQNNGRISWADLSNLLKLSSSSTAERVKKLEDQGIIQGYSAIIDYKALGIDLMAQILVILEKPANRDEFIEEVKKTEEIEECYHIVGEYDYLLKVRCKNIEALEKLISIKIKEIPGILKTSTTVILSTIKEKKSLLLEEKKK
jgi:Lrp/AsnC family leucine-responsive transcriptional regulator